MNNGKQEEGTHCTKMGADKPAENTSNLLYNLSPICPSPRVWYFDEKKASLAVRNPWCQASINLRLCIP